MRVLFIYPNINAQIGFNYGVSYISGLLKAQGIETWLLNVNEQLDYPLDMARIRRDVERIDPDIIGFSVLTNQYKYALQIAEDVKKYRDTPVMFGGIHPTMDPGETLSHDVVDSICLGEGEEAFLEVVTKGSAEGVRNMGYRKEGHIVLEPLRPFTDLATLPFKDYTIFDFQKMIDAKDGWVGLLASRGCPFRCTYCLNHKIIQLYKDSGHLPKHYVRKHAVDEVIAEIEYLLTHYTRITMFIFDDDIFTFDREWLREFSEKYRQVTKTGFVVNAHVKMFDEDVARSLKEAGCRIVKFGLESGSERIRRNVLSRYMSNTDIEKAFAVAHKFGLHTSAFVMIGLPFEEKEDVLATIRLLSRIQPGRFRWSLFFPFVGTRAYDIARDHGSIDFDKMASLDNFTDETCMDLGEDVNLLVEKVKGSFCAFVNGYADADGAGAYGDIISRIEKADRARWGQEKEETRGLIADLDNTMDKETKLHYQVRFNRFMGVRNDWEDDSLSS
jgi:radical SAM superfamily enzyme YgiQ (UPF0313 family)